MGKFGNEIKEKGFDFVSKYSIYINDEKSPLTLNSEEDCEAYFDYMIFYAIEHATFDGITYDHVMRLLSPDYGTSSSTHPE